MAAEHVIKAAGDIPCEFQMRQLVPAYRHVFRVVKHDICGLKDSIDVCISVRGGTVTMNFYDPHGRFIDHALIEAEANRRRISLRTGCFCNPGAGELALGISKPELAACFSQPGHERLSYDDFRLCIDGKASGAVRISVGLVSNFADAQALLAFAERLLE